MATDALGQNVTLPDNTLTPLGGSQIAQTGNEIVRRVVMNFATAAARDAAITAAGLTTAQKKGIIAYQVDTQKWYGCDDGTTWVELFNRRQWTYTYVRGTTDNFLSGLGFVSLQVLTVPSAPAGDYLITFSGGLYALAQNAGNLRILANGTNISGDVPCDLSTIRIPMTWTAGYRLVTAGTLTVEVFHQPTASTNTIATGATTTASWQGPR